MFSQYKRFSLVVKRIYLSTHEPLVKQIQKKWAWTDQAQYKLVNIKEWH